ncbi:hypothetical protein AMS68_000149 [Peltaster fructicola]|uniref:C2H2-type domain-containing protein n=1 Tax=Peltaster fructicola TaxID=286661 RepID=A0A6H0XIT8_9PEZI|nr:hypothetical protein AMS68_000149 [Peltaster fructicola]
MGNVTPCRIDCESWEDLTKHKSDLMAPFLSGEMKGKPEHIVCEFCGAEFNTFGGRKGHRETKHKAYHDVVCPGCSLIFDRAFHMIAHLEDGGCTEISRSDFEFSIQKKHINAEFQDSSDFLISDLDRLGRSSTTQSTASTIAYTSKASDATRSLAESVTSQRNPAASTASDNMSTAAHNSDSDEDEDGVALEDDSDGESDATLEVPQTRQHLETWPRLPGLPSARATESISSSFAKVSMAATSNSSVSELKLDSDRDSRKAQVVRSSAAGTEQIDAWRHEVGSKSLTRHPEETMAVVKRAPMEVVQVQKSFNLDLCNFKSTEYDPERFFDRTIDKYICPFQSCMGNDFVDAMEFNKHFQRSHTRERFPCPACGKVFYKPSAFVQHLEVGNKCRLSEAKQLQKVVDDYTGGFLGAKSIDQSLIYRAKAGATMEGVVKMQFTSDQPYASTNSTKAIRW